MGMDQFPLFVWTEILGTLAFSLAGAAKAIQKQMDLFGVLMMGLTTAFGGGLVRDLILGHTPPRAFADAPMVLLALAGAAGMFLVCEWNFLRRRGTSWKGFDQIVNIFDALGLGAFAILGTQAALDTGSRSLLLCVSLGTITGVGGGVLRDIFCQEIPSIFVKHIYALAAILGSLLYFYLWKSGMSLSIIGVIVILLVFFIRLAATIWQLDLPKIPEDKH